MSRTGKLSLYLIFCEDKTVLLNVRMDENDHNLGARARTVLDKQRQAATPLHIIMDSVRLLAQLRTRHYPHKAHLVRLIRESQAVATGTDVSCWGHHFCAYNKMADRLARITMNT